MYKKRIKNRLIMGISIILAGVIALFLITDKLAREIIVNNIETAAANTFIDITNKAMGEVLETYEIDYNDLANIQLDNNGNIVAVTCDTVKLMQIKTVLDDVIKNYVKKEPKIKFIIPLGSFTGNEYFAGRGPKIPFEFTYDCATMVEFKSEFYDAGINQTIHRIVLHLTADMATVIPWDYKEVLVDTTHIVAETIIVGKIPSNYTNVELDELNNKLNN